MSTLAPPSAPLTTLLSFHKSIRLAMATVETSAGLASAGLFDVIKVSALVDFFEGPLRWHDEDEASSLFPRLLQADRARALAPLTACAQEHARVETTIASALEHLRALAHDDAAPDPELLHATSAALQRLLEPHLQREEREIFPLAKEVLSPADLDAIGLEMHVRRLRRLAAA